MYRKSLELKKLNIDEQLVKKLHDEGFKTVYDYQFAAAYKKAIFILLTDSEMEIVDQAIDGLDNSHIITEDTFKFIFETNILTEREKNIFIKLLQGESGVNIATEYNLSKQRVYQVANKAENKYERYLKDISNPDFSDFKIKYNLSTRTSNCIMRAGIKSISDLVRSFETADIYRIRNVGKTTLEEIARALDDHFNTNKYSNHMKIRNKFSWDKDKEDSEIYHNGTSILWVCGRSKAIQRFVEALSTRIGYKCDFSFIAGRAHIDVDPRGKDAALAAIESPSFMNLFIVPYSRETYDNETYFEVMWNR